tara:strand:- start:83 stop:373 length:291 start_codon:yes stop_codon:yes gene_type:complete
MVSSAHTEVVKRVIRTLKAQCVHRHCFESIQHASRVIGGWISFYNNRRSHQALAMRTPAEAFRLVAKSFQMRQQVGNPLRWLLASDFCKGVLCTVW